VVPQDEVELLAFLRSATGGVHIVCATGPDSVAAASVVARAIRRGGVGLSGLTAIGPGERPDSPAARAWLHDVPSLLRIGLGAVPSIIDGIDGTRGADGVDGTPQLSIDGDVDGGEPLAARAFRLAQTITHVGDAGWCAAVGLIRRAPSHFLVERALGRCARVELEHIAELIDGAARAPEPAALSLMTVEMLAEAVDPRRFLASVPAEYLRQAHAQVRAELQRVARIRPRPGLCTLVVEYDSECRVEDLVAACWRGLRPGTSILVANHGAVAGKVCLFDGETTLVEREVWAARLERLGVGSSLATA
jgi:hypothetical protein